MKSKLLVFLQAVLPLAAVSIATALAAEASGVPKPTNQIVVSPQGPRDGGDFGPHTPGTKTSGLQEALDAAKRRPRTFTWPAEAGPLTRPSRSSATCTKRCASPGCRTSGFDCPKLAFDFGNRQVGVPCDAVPRGDAHRQQHRQQKSHANEVENKVTRTIALS